MYPYKIDSPAIVHYLFQDMVNDPDFLNIEMAEVDAERMLFSVKEGKHSWFFEKQPSEAEAKLIFQQLRFNQIATVSLFSHPISPAISEFIFKANHQRGLYGYIFGQIKQYIFQATKCKLFKKVENVIAREQEPALSIHFSFDIQTVEARVEILFDHIGVYDIVKTGNFFDRSIGNCKLVIYYKISALSAQSVKLELTDYFLEYTNPEVMTIFNQCIGSFFSIHMIELENIKKIPEEIEEKDAILAVLQFFLTSPTVSMYSSLLKKPLFPDKFFQRKACFSKIIDFLQPVNLANSLNGSPTRSTGSSNYGTPTGRSSPVLLVQEMGSINRSVPSTPTRPSGNTTPQTPSSPSTTSDPLLWTRNHRIP
jgi:hypothetical protein